MNEEIEIQPPLSLDQFIRWNAESTVALEGDAYVISKPWGDDSIELRVSPEARPLADALNSVRLLPRFSAVWHTDSADAEFIFGPVPENDELLNRRFVFNFEGQSLTCEFSQTSERVVHLANAARPIRPSSTDQRNLQEVRAFARFQRSMEARGERHAAQLTSFWIRDCRLGEDELPRLARHLNFYMRYFDRRSPIILVHEDPVGRAAFAPTRFLLGPFPSEIAARRLDPYMLTLWEGGGPGIEPVRSFLYNYQILEYAAFYYLKEELARTIRRILSSPDITVRSEEASRQILDVLVEERTSEDAKIASVIQHAVDPAVLWKEIESKQAFFSEPTEFEGGFVIPALIKQGWSLDDFRAAWIPKVPDSFRKLRNALLHAREQRLSKCISPGRLNASRLRPWSFLMAIASSQIILFGDS